MRSKRSRTASSVAPPAAQSCRIIASPRIGRADSVTPRPGLAEARGQEARQRPRQGDRRDRHRHRDRDQGDRQLTRGQTGAIADQQRRRGDADALAEDAEARVEGEGDEEAVGAAADAEGVEVEQCLDARGEAHRHGRDRHRHAGMRVLLAQILAVVPEFRQGSSGWCGRSCVHVRLTGESVQYLLGPPRNWLKSCERP